MRSIGTSTRWGPSTSTIRLSRQEGLPLVDIRGNRTSEIVLVLTKPGDDTTGVE
ncbi:hypothetical protein [Paraburkholderia hospita]|jgi:hypothetical protein|uniref:hypothetical protein n=1 Tax=Paraburkholderia hospita TaxID=169430 RepID=UPI0013FDA7CC|nr:hypothetical protein [Paraburkholderia hospita]